MYRAFAAVRLLDVVASNDPPDTLLDQHVTSMREEEVSFQRPAPDQKPQLRLDLRLSSFHPSELLLTLTIVYPTTKLDLFAGHLQELFFVRLIPGTELELNVETNKLDGPLC